MNTEKMSKNELSSTISKQNEQIKRYESRLRDVVTAYKGLVREKKALEASLAAINKSDDASVGENSVSTLALSLATLSAEKERLEEAFQNDKRTAREQNDKLVKDLQEQLDSLGKQRQSELENLRAKLAFEIQEREREHTEHSLMIKELQMKLISEKRSKEKMEDKFVISSDNIVNNLELEKRFRDLNSELEATQRKLNRAEARTLETPQMLVQLQEEIAVMKQNHVTAIREERIKSKRAEEMAKRMCASQEERVATLEARLAELSETVGEYDRQRRKDQEVIQQLRNNVSSSPKEKSELNIEREKRKSLVEDILSGQLDTERPVGMAYLQEIIDKVHSLKKELIIVNETIGSPVDIWSIFNQSGSNAQSIHSACRAELTALRTEYELYKKQLSQNYSSTEMVQQRNANKNDVEKLKSHIKTLQNKVEVLNQQIEETEKDCDVKINEQLECTKNERATHKEELSEYKSRVISLEQQLQKQRERYSTLLGEREGEIRARHVKEEEGKVDGAKYHDINGSLQEVSAPPHMLHYAHELARKDLEISALRKEKHVLEGQYRDCQRDATIEKDRFKEVRRNLKEEIDRLLRIQSREGANLEYLKNVVLSFLLSTDLFRKKHMLKAIAAVLHFTETEKKNAYKAAL